MTTLIVKLVLTPSLIALATLLGRRFGQSFAGWLVGFPFTSGPVSLFLAIEHGTDFAATAAVGSIGSVIAQAAFALTYARTASRGWSVALGAAAIAFAATGALARFIALTPLVLTFVAWAVLAAVIRAMPRRVTTAVAPPPPRWDLPARMIVATVLVLALTTFAPVLGAFTSGVIAGFPLYATVLGVFAHRATGAGAAVAVMRGLTAGLFAFATFFLVISSFVVTLGIGGTFLIATIAIVAVQAVSFVALRRSS